MMLTRMKNDGHNLDELISRYLDHSASPAEIENLMTQIRKNPEAADSMRDLLLQHAQLQTLFSETADEYVQTEIPAAVPDESVRRLAFSSASWFGGPWKRALSWAACILVIFGAAFGLMRLGRLFYSHSDIGDALPVVREWDGTIQNAQDAKPALAGLAATAPPGAVEIFRFEDGTLLRLESDSSAQIISIGSSTEGKTILLLSGAITANVATQPEGLPFRLTTPHMEAVVAGTRFHCRIREDYTHIRMYHGWAHITHALRGNKIRLNAGYHVSAGKNMPFAARSWR